MAWDSEAEGRPGECLEDCRPWSVPRAGAPSGPLGARQRGLAWGPRAVHTPHIPPGAAEGALAPAYAWLRSSLLKVWLRAAHTGPASCDPCPGTPPPPWGPGSREPWERKPTHAHPVPLGPGRGGLTTCLCLEPAWAHGSRPSLPQGARGHGSVCRGRGLLPAHLGASR